MRANSIDLSLTFETAVGHFLKEEGQYLLTEVSERSTCGRLAMYVERQIRADGFTEYYADVEYNRKQNGEVKTIINENAEVIRITADLIVHSRGKFPNPRDNLIAVEVKKFNRPESEKNSDRSRLVAMTSDPNKNVWGWNGSHPEHVCGYSVGIFMEIDTSNKCVRLEFFKKGKFIDARILAFS